MRDDTKGGRTPLSPKRCQHHGVSRLFCGIGAHVIVSWDGCKARYQKFHRTPTPAAGQQQRRALLGVACVKLFARLTRCCTATPYIANMLIWISMHAVGRGSLTTAKRQQRDTDYRTACAGNGSRPYGSSCPSTTQRHRGLRSETLIKYFGKMICLATGAEIHPLYFGAPIVLPPYARALAANWMAQQGARRPPSQNWAAFSAVARLTGFRILAHRYGVPRPL